MEHSPDGTRRPVLLVLGMHRSGTSATAGFLARLGARMAATPIRADRNNPHGYWEPEPLVSLHDRLLAAAGSAWDDWGPLDGTRFDEACLDGTARETLAAAFLSEFGDEGLAVLKDPRICRFLPLWRQVLADVGATPLAVLPLRHPLEVAGSLARRDGMAEEEALLLWLRHALEAEAGTRALPRAFLRYEDLLADWRAVADRLAATLGLAWPVDPEAVAEEVGTFLARDLRHHAADPDAPLPAWAAEAWAALSALEAGGAATAESAAAAEALPRLDALRATVDAGDALMGVAARRQARRATEAEADAARLRQEAAATLAHHEAVRAALAAHVAELERAHGARVAHVAELEQAHGAAVAAHAAEVATLAARTAAAEAARAAEREAFLASRSWRMTAPLRALGRLAGRPDALPGALPDTLPGALPPTRREAGPEAARQPPAGTAHASPDHGA